MGFRDGLVTMVFVGVAMGFYDVFIKSFYLNFIGAQGGVIGWGQASLGYIVSGAIGLVIAKAVVWRKRRRQPDYLE